MNNRLPYVNKGAKAFVVPNRGLYIYGGDNRGGGSSYLDRLTSVDGAWIASAPALFQGWTSGHCIVQVSVFSLKIVISKNTGTQLTEPKVLKCFK